MNRIPQKRIEPRIQEMRQIPQKRSGKKRRKNQKQIVIERIGGCGGDAWKHACCGSWIRSCGCGIQICFHWCWIHWRKRMHWMRIHQIHQSRIHLQHLIHPSHLCRIRFLHQKPICIGRSNRFQWWVLQSLFPG